MKLLLYFVLIISCSAFAQNIENIKLSDTIYIYCNKSDKENSRVKLSVGENYAIVDYTFSNTDGKTILLRTSKGRSDETIKCRKDFFSENRDKIIDFTFIEKQGLEKTFFEILNADRRKIKFILISDKSKRKILLRDASIAYPGFLEM